MNVLKYIFRNKMSLFDFIGILVFTALMTTSHYVTGVVVLLLFNIIGFYMDRLLGLGNDK